MKDNSNNDPAAVHSNSVREINGINNSAQQLKVNL
jgi:hypothetical protein